MKIFYRVCLDNPEVQGMFDYKGELLGSWSSDDANWRSEYFSEFLEKLGVQEEKPSKTLEKKLIKRLQEEYKEFME